jgi:hypothetical protein
MPTRALRFDILRAVETSPTERILLKERPICVATLLNEHVFEEFDHCLLHGRSVFIEDQMHDWQYVAIDIGGYLRFYPRVGDTVDVLVIYEWDEDYELPVRFDPQTGERVA